MALAPHDALPAPDCLARIVAELDARPAPGWPAPTTATAARPSSTPTSAASPAPATVAEGWEAAGYPHGTLLVARRACLDDIGLFDERYFAYCEEADLGVRARRAGWEVGLVRGAMVRNPDVHGALAAVAVPQLRNTLLLVRETSGATTPSSGSTWPPARSPSARSCQGSETRTGTRRASSEAWPTSPEATSAHPRRTSWPARRCRVRARTAGVRANRPLMSVGAHTSAARRVLAGV